MKYLIPLIIAAITGGFVAWHATTQTTELLEAQNLGANPFTLQSNQLAPSPQANYILSTDGTDNSWIVNSGGGGGSTLHVDGGGFVYPQTGDYHSAPKYIATSTTEESVFVNASTTLLTVSGTIWGNLTGNVTGNADTATALAVNGANCSAGNSPLGVDASGAVESCFDVWTEAENTSAAYISNLSGFDTDDLTQGATNLYNQTHTGDVTGATALTIAADVVDFADINFGNTLAGNPALLVDECYFAKTTSGGGFICEGSTADTAEQLYLFPDLNGSDTTDTIATLGSAQTFSGIKTISSNWVNTANPWADNEVADTLTIGASSVIDIDAVTGDTSDDDDLDVAAGGTGVSTLTDGGVLLGNGTGDLVAMSVLTDGQIIIGDGTTDPTVLTAFTSSTGDLIHEAGGLEADVSGYTNGLYGMLSGVTADIDTLSEFNTALGGSILSGLDATIITGTAGTAGNCAEWDANGDLVDAGAACGTGGGGSGAGWATTTDDVEVTYTSPNNPVYIGGSSSTTAEFIFDYRTSQLKIASSTAATSTITDNSGNDAIRLNESGGNGMEIDFGAGTSAIFRGLGNVVTFIIESGYTFIANGGARIANFLEIPNDANPTVNATGEIALDTTSGQLKVYDGSEVDVYVPTFDKSWSIASTSPDYTLTDFANGTTTWEVAHFALATTLNSIRCETDTGTAGVRVGDGTNWTEFVACGTAPTRDTSLSNGTFTAEEDFIIEIGTSASNPNWVTVDMNLKTTAD